MATTYLTVTSTELVMPCLRRLWFRSDDLSAFADSICTDRDVKLVIPQEGVTYPEPLDMRALRKVLPAEDMPSVRTFPALFPDIEHGTLAIDFVLHGDAGIAGPWVAAAAHGDRLIVNGPGGAYRADPTADWHLLVGDESALPAIMAALVDLPEDAVVRVVALVESGEDEPRLEMPSGGEVTFVHRSEVGPEGGLEEAVRALDWLPGRVHVFVHGEAREVMRRLRPYLLGERELLREQVSISGYRRRGRNEERFREGKAELPRSEGVARS